MSTANARADVQTGREVVLPEHGQSELTEPKFTATQIEKNCPARLQQIATEIAERHERARKQAGIAADHLIAIEKLLAEAKGLCDRGGFNKFRELYCPNLRKSQAYALRAIAGAKKTFAEHRTEERERKRKSQQTRRPWRQIPGQSRKSQTREKVPGQVPFRSPTARPSKRRSRLSPEVRSRRVMEPCAPLPCWSWSLTAGPPSDHRSVFPQQPFRLMFSHG